MVAKVLCFFLVVLFCTSCGRGLYRNISNELHVEKLGRKSSPNNHSLLRLMINKEFIPFVRHSSDTLSVIQQSFPGNGKKKWTFWNKKDTISFVFLPINDSQSELKVSSFKSLFCSRTLESVYNLDTNSLLKQRSLNRASAWVFYIFAGKIADVNKISFYTKLCLNTDFDQAKRKEKVIKTWEYRSE